MSSAENAPATPFDRSDTRGDKPKASKMIANPLSNVGK